MRKNSRRIGSLMLIMALVLGMSAVMLSGCGKEETAEPERVYNRLTGDETNTAEGKRSVAIVVENTIFTHFF